MKNFLFLFIFVIGCAEQPIRGPLISPFEETQKVRAQKLVELREAFSLLAKAKALCIEMQDWLRLAKSETLKKRLEDLSNNTDPIDYTVKMVLEYLKECEEAFTAFKLLPPQEFQNKKDMEWILHYFEDISLSSEFTSREKEKILALLNIKEYPVSIPGFSKKRVKLALKRVAAQLRAFLPRNRDERETWYRFQVEAMAEAIMLPENEELSAEQLGRITQLVQKVFSLR